MILGIDIGTSVTKAAVIDRFGRCIAQSSESSRLVRYPDGRVEQDLEEVIASVSKVALAVAKLSPGQIEAVALTAQGDGLWLRDGKGKSVRPPISWLDSRASSTVEQWSAGARESVIQKVFNLTGAGIFAGSQGALLAHLSEHEPETLERATVAGHCADAVLQRLTGVVTVDASDACMPFLNVSTRQYVADAIELCGLTEWSHLLAKPAEALELFHLDSVGAELLGLPVGTPVTGGPFDVQSCGIGSGSFYEGEGTIVLGTTLSCQVYTKNAAVEQGSEPAGMWLCTPQDQLYLRVMPSMVGTASLDWMRTLFNFENDQLGSILTRSPAGANGVKALSFLSVSGERAPFVEPNARGQLTGLNVGTTQADIVRAMCESVAYASRHIFETLGLSGELSATGGGMKSRAWAQLFADVNGTPIYIPREELVGARGAALVAWDALGKPVDKQQWRNDRETITPNPEYRRVYDDGFRGYLSSVRHARSQWSRQGQE